MPRVLLLLPTATYRAPDFLAAAGALGAEVVVGSEQAQTLAGAMGDRALTVPLDDPEAAAEAITELAGRRPLDAVVAVDDQGVLVAALASRRLGLAHNPPEAVARTRDKAAMRAALGLGQAGRSAARQPDSDPIWEKPTVSSAAVAGSERVMATSAVAARRALEVMRRILPKMLFRVPASPNSVSRHL